MHHFEKVCVHNTKFTYTIGSTLSIRGDEEHGHL